MWIWRGLARASSPDPNFMTRSASRLLIEFIALAFLLAIFLVGFGLMRFADGPVDLDVLLPDAEAAFREALGNDAASMGSIETEWRVESRAIVVTARDIALRSEDGLLPAAERISVALPVAELALRRFSPLWVEVDGGALTVRRDRDGQIRYGLGPPDAMLARDIGQGPGDPNASRRGDFQRLARVTLSDMTLHVGDAVLGVNGRLNGVSLDADIAGTVVDARIFGALEQSGGPAPFNAVISADLSTGRMAAQGGVENFSPAQSGPRRGAAAVVRRLDAPLDLEGNIAIGRDGELSAGRFRLSAEPGRFEGPEGLVDLSALELAARFDPARSALILEDLTVDSTLASWRASGQARGPLIRQDAPIAIEIDLQDIRVDYPEVFSDTLAVEALDLSGAFDPETHDLIAESLTFQIGTMTGAFSGALELSQTEAGLSFDTLRVSGETGGYTTPETVLAFWPEDFANGGWVWIRDHVNRGRVRDARLDLVITAEALANGRLADEDMTLDFAMDGARVRYVSTMSPITNGSGTATLRGNSFSLTMETGRIGGIVLTEGRVEIPRLKPKGAPALIAGAGRAEAEAVLALLDEPPLGFPSGFGIDPASVTGEGDIRFEIIRPMRSEVPVERIGFDVEADFDGVSAPALAGLRLEDASVRLEADPFGLLARGAGRIGPIETSVEWRERFGEAEDVPSTEFRLAGALDRADFDAMGAPLRQVLSGPIPFEIKTEGSGLDIENGSAVFDLTSAQAFRSDAIWSKPKDTPARAETRFAISEDGLRVEDLRLTGPGLDATGAARFEADGRLDTVSLSRLQIEQIADAQLTLKRGEDSFELSGEGAFLDLSPLVQGFLGDSGGAGLGVPIMADLRLDEAKVSQSVTLTGFELSLNHDGETLRTASISGQAESGALAFAMTPALGEARRIEASGEDAGLLFQTLFNNQQVRGGAFTIDVQSDRPDAPWRFDVAVDDFEISEAPILARIFSLASLEGFADALRGDGLGFASLTADGALGGGELTINNARASGQALGITTTGAVDLNDEAMALSGVLIPSYGVNAALGELPVIGELLTSREGEGVFSLTYSVSGPFEETQVAVNPLSALAPGILRRAFEGDLSLEEVRKASEARRAAEDSAGAATTEGEEAAPEAEPDEG